MRIALRRWLVRGLSVALLLVGAFAAPLFAQTLPPPTADDQLGMLPYQSYHGGDIDHINLSNGDLNIDLPFLVYPQRGKLHLAFDLFYNDQAQHQVKLCPPVGGCQFPWGYKPIPSPLPLERSDAYVGIAEQFEVLGTTASLKNGDYTTYYDSWYLQTADGAKHPLGNEGTMTKVTNGTQFYYEYSGPFESLDATAWRVNGTFESGPITWYNEPPTSVVDSDGVSYDSSTSLEQDPNGNQITESAGVVTDSLNRSIPLPPTSASTSNTSSAACPQSPLPVAFAVLWSPPGYNGVSASYTFCYVTVAINIPPNSPETPSSTSPQNSTKLQSIVLPNGQSWNFTYNDPGDGSTYNGAPVNFGTLTQITLPTGGTISYSYSMQDAAACANAGRWVAQRTVNANDGSGSHTWTYSYTLPFPSSTTVTDPLGNYVVHTFGQAQCQGYETNTQYYQNGGTLLKSVVTAYSIGSSCNPPVTSNYVPTQITTTWANGTLNTSQTAKTYDAGFSCSNFDGAAGTAVYGKILTETESDYGNGSPGSILRTTTNTYQALNSSAYLTNNLLNLPASVKVTGASATSYVTYGYDETTPLSSGVSTQHTLPPPDGSALGNQTSIHRQLNNGTAVAVGTCPAVSSGGYLVTNVSYFDTGMADVSTDPCTYTTTYGYLPAYYGGYLTSITNAKNQTTNYGYDFNTGLLTSVKDPNSQTTSYTYDNMWRMASASYPDGGSSVVTRQETTFPNTATLTKLISTSPALNYVTTNTFDGLGRVSQNEILDSVGNIFATTTYDADGRKSVVSNPYRTASDSTYGFTTYGYDGLSRTTSVTEPDGSTVTTQYCGGSSTLVTDEAGHWRRSELDGLGRLIEVDEPNSLSAPMVNVCPGSGEQIWITNYTYDVLGDLLSVVQGGSHNRTFAYNSLKHLTSSTNPETGSTAVNYAYDADSNVHTKADGRGVTITYSYEQLNRMSGRSYSNGDPTVSYTYDQTTCVVGGTGYNIGRRTSMTDAGGSESWCYDPMGREKGEQRITASVTKTTAYTYDLMGGLATLTYPSGRTVTYTPNDLDKPIEVEDIPNALTYASGGAYAPQQSLAALEYGSAYNSTFIYNNRLQPCWIYVTTSSALPTSTLCTATASAAADLDLKYNFNLGVGDNGNVIGITNNRDTTRSQQFVYDQVNRLTSGETTSTYSTSPSHCWGEAYVYDNQSSGSGEYGNLTNINVASTSYNGCTQEPLSVSTSTSNQIASFSYDGVGNTLSDTHNTYAYNAESEIKTGAGVNYIYDGDGNRIEKVGSKFYWYGAGSAILDESDSSGNITDEYVYFGGKRISHRVVSGNVITYYGEDMLGTSRVILPSTAGSPCYDADFYPFGGERDYTATCAQNYKFEGKERDTETNNDDFGGRYYASWVGRWESPDWSSTPVPVPYANLTNPQTLNLYMMATDDPETFADLDGHCGDPSSPGCVLVFFQAVQDFAAHPADYVESFLAGAVKQELSTVRDNLGLKPDSTLAPTNDVERAGGAALSSAADVASVLLPFADAGGPGGLKEPGGTFVGPKEGSSGGPYAGKAFDPPTKQAAVDENVAANGGDARCVYCGVKVTNDPGPNKVNIDHKDAKANGGNSTLKNAQVTCQHCNQSKGTGPAPKTKNPNSQTQNP